MTKLEKWLVEKLSGPGEWRNGKYWTHEIISANKVFRLKERGRRLARLRHRG